MQPSSESKRDQLRPGNKSGKNDADVFYWIIRFCSCFSSLFVLILQRIKANISTAAAASEKNCNNSANSSSVTVNWDAFNPPRTRKRIIYFSNFSKLFNFCTQHSSDTVCCCRKKNTLRVEWWRIAQKSALVAFVENFSLSWRAWRKKNTCNCWN